MFELVKKTVAGKADRADEEGQLVKTFLELARTYLQEDGQAGKKTARAGKQRS